MYLNLMMRIAALVLCAVAVLYIIRVVQNAS
jgi:hypothetical protein